MRKLRQFCSSWRSNVHLVVAFAGIFVVGITLLREKSLTRTAHAAALPGMAHPAAKKSTAAPIPAPAPEMRVIVHLPSGEKFVQFIPGNDENQNIGDGFRLHNHIMTEKRPKGENPRQLTVFGPGPSPGSLYPVLYIQEH